MQTGLIYVFITIFFTVYGQLVIKWQMSLLGELPSAWSDKLSVLLISFFNPWILSAFASAFLAALSWMAAMTKLDLNYAYPLMSLSFVLVFIFGSVFLHEQVSLVRIIGMLLILGGISVICKS